MAKWFDLGEEPPLIAYIYGRDLHCIRGRACRCNTQRKYELKAVKLFSACLAVFTSSVLVMKVRQKAFLYFV
jgi:hypothetical protein